MPEDQIEPGRLTTQASEALMARLQSSYDAGEFASAAELAGAGLSLCGPVDEVGNPVRARLLNARGLMRHRCGHLEDAATDFHAASAAWAVQPPEAFPRSRAALKTNLGNLLVDLGRFDEAQAALEEAEAIDARLADGAPTVALAASRGNLSRLHVLTGRVADGVRMAHSALALIAGEGAESPESPDTAEMLAAIVAPAEHAFGDLVAAQRSYERALIGARRLRRPATEAQALNGLGSVLFELGDFAGALELQTEARAILRELAANGRSIDLAAIDLNLAAVLHRLGRFEEALAAARKAQRQLGELLPRVPHRLWVNLRRNIGTALLRLERLASARRQFEIGIRIARRAGEAFATDVADLRFHVGETWFGDAREDLAFRHARKALRQLGARRQPDLRWRVLSLLGRAAPGGGPSRILFGKIAIRELEDRRRELQGAEQRLVAAFMESRGQVFLPLVDQLVEAGRIVEAQQVLEALRREEVETLFVRARAPTPIEGSAMSGIGLTDAEQAMAGGFKAALAEPDAERVGQALDDWVADVLKNCGSRDSAFRNPSELPDDIDVDLAGLPRASGLVVLAPTRRRLWSVFAARGLPMVRHCAEIGEAELNRMVFDLRLLLSRSDGSMADLLRLSGALYDLLLRPLEKAIEAAGVERLVFQPEGALRLLPPALLHDGRRFVVDRWTLQQIAPRAPRAPGIRADRIAGFASTAAGGGMPSLANARREVEAIVRQGDHGAGLAPGRRFIDEAFTADALAEAAGGDFTVLHIASHFVLQPASLRRSGLVLGDGSILTGEALAELDLPGRPTIVLSACNTATDPGGDAYFGSLADQLIDNGAAAVMATLWPVADGSTARLMIDFYRRLRQDPAGDAAAALRHAQRRMLHGGPGRAGGPATSRDAARGIGGPPASPSTILHPFHWAAMILIEAPRATQPPDV